MKIIRYNFLMLLVLYITGSYSQTRVFEQNHNTKADVEIEVNSSHTNVVVEYWDRDEVKVEGLLEGREETARELKDSWNPEITVSREKIRIHSGAVVIHWEESMKKLEEPLASLPEMLGPIINDLVTPLLENISKHPLPPEFSENLGNIKFDYEAYRREGDEYLERFEKEMETNFGEDFERSMEEWAQQFEKDSARWKNFERNMEDWGEHFGKDMEAWGEQFGKQMEAWGENFGRDMEQWAQALEAQTAAQENAGKFKMQPPGGARKTLKLTLPKKARLNLDIRHGEVSLNGKTTNLKGDISHGRFSAGTLSGKETELKLAYTPVKIRNWDYGVLKVSYVKDFRIEKARSIKLHSTSSDIILEEIAEIGILSGSFGELKINHLQPGFSMLEVNLENSDLELKLPDTAFNFSYNGTKSEINTPSELQLRKNSSYDMESLSGYRKSRDAGAAINIKASFSEILLN